MTSARPFLFEINQRLLSELLGLDPDEITEETNMCIESGLINPHGKIPVIIDLAYAIEDYYQDKGIKLRLSEADLAEINTFGNFVDLVVQELQPIST